MKPEVDTEAKGIKPLLDAVLTEQVKLLKKIDELEKENRPLREDERYNFLTTVGYALLGFEHYIPLEVPIKLRCGKLVGITAVENASDLIRFIAFYNGKRIGMGDGSIDIGEVWRYIRELVLKAMPIAIECVMLRGMEKEGGMRFDGRRAIVRI